jgi:hypothetical protein
MKTSICAALVALVASASALAGNDKHHMAPPAMPSEFTKMKDLVGTWEGSSKMHGQDQTIKATYELTSGGTVLMERLMAGTPMEMVTMYHRMGKTVGATHYCMVGNKPEMKFKKGDDKSMSFEMMGTQGIGSSNEMHMHSLTLTWVDADHIRQEWVSWDKGKKQEPTVIELARKK